MIKDLYYALRKVNLTFTRVKTEIIFLTQLRLQINSILKENSTKAFLRTLVVNWAWLCQQTGVLHPIECWDHYQRIKVKRRM